MRSTNSVTPIPVLFPSVFSSSFFTKAKQLVIFICFALTFFCFGIFFFFNPSSSSLLHLPLLTSSSLRHSNPSLIPTSLFPLPLYREAKQNTHSNQVDLLLWFWNPLTRAVEGGSLWQYYFEKVFVGLYFKAFPGVVLRSPLLHRCFLFTANLNTALMRTKLILSGFWDQLTWGSDCMERVR